MSTTPTSRSSEAWLSPAVRALLLLVALAGAAVGCGGGKKRPPCVEGTEACACRDGRACDQGLTCTGGTCRTCLAGQASCACRSNGTCDSGLACDNGDICASCTAGAAGCPCRPDETCDPGLACSAAELCVPGGCTPGSLDCACTAGGTCAVGLVCVSGSCHTCATDVPGCPCQDGACQGLVCEAGTCRTARSCADACGAHRKCTPATPATDPGCLDACDSGWIWNPAAQRCDPMPTSCPPCTAAGEDGVWPSLTQNGRCICKTKPGFFYTLSGLVGTFPCDADQDGWTRTTAWYALTSGEPAIRENARCDVRSVGTIVLHNDHGQARSFALGEGLPLYETVRNDDQGTLDLDPTGSAVPVYGGSSGRRLRAAEINSLTKACVTARADHNDNQLADVAEWGRPMLDQAPLPSGAFTGEQRGWFELYTRFSYFLELNRGWYEAGSAGAPGLYHVAEKDRTLGAGFPLVYGREPSGQLTSDYWRECPRGRDVWYRTDEPPVGMDFASLSPPSPEWKGMGHSSQFKCVQVVDEATYAGAEPSRERHLQTLRTLGFPPGGSPEPSSYLRAAVNACIADPGASQGAGRNPADPVISCQAYEPAEWQVGRVYWAAVGLANTSSYHRGCILQCDGFAYLCPGTDPQAPSPQGCYHVCADVTASETGDLRSAGGMRLRGGVPATGPVTDGPVSSESTGYRISPR